jgi:hypothetical protein
VTVETVRGGRHFLSLDRPQDLQRLILRFAASNKDQHVA